MGGLDYLDKMIKCHYCKKEINENERFCELISHDNGSITNEDAWHSECWKIYWEEKMDKKVKDYASEIMKQSAPLIGNNKEVNFLKKMMGGNGLI